VLVGSAESITDTVLYAVSDYYIYPRFHFFVVCLFVCFSKRFGMLSQGFLCR
jgi:hypothetical protein